MYLNTITRLILCSQIFKKCSIDHNILAVKLHCLGFRNPFLSKLISFISNNRKQIVKYENFYISSFKVTSGVPQTSHIVPLLYNLFINDIKLSNYFHKIAFSSSLQLLFIQSRTHCLPEKRFRYTFWRIILCSLCI